MKSKSLFLPLLAFLCLPAVLPTTTTGANIESPAASNFLSGAEGEILAEINLARTQPQQYAAYVEEFKKYYKGQHIVLPGRRPISTFDGVAAVDEAIAFLRAAKPVTALEAS